MKAQFLGLTLFLLVVSTILIAQDTAEPIPALTRESLARLPIYFIENRGVYPDGVKYYIQGADKTLFFTKEGITFRLEGKDQAWVVKLEFVGANPDVEPLGADRQQAVFSYFSGSEKDWKTGLPTYSRIVYADLWPGIDLVYKAGVKQMKYEFIVKPGADPGTIRLRYRGATAVTLAPSGALRLEAPVAAFEDAPPVAWQEIGGKHVPVTTAYALGPEGQFQFRLGAYDTTRTLVLDPAVIVYCGYLGGSASDNPRSIAVDASGNVYVTGMTQSTEIDFPVKVGPDPTFNGSWDAFVAKVNAQGTALVYCGYIGGSGSDQGLGIAVDAAGNAFLSGRTRSDEQTFPVKVGPDLTYNGRYGAEDAFVAKVNAQGTALVYCGYIGGSGPSGTRCSGIAVDAAGNAYVTGETDCDPKTFPVKVGPDLTHNGGQDVFVAKVNAQGSALVYCGYIGGGSYESGSGIAVDAAGNAYLIGSTQSTETSFPVKVGPDLTHNGGQDVFVAKVNAQGSALDYCGYIGGGSSGMEIGMGIAVDAAGNAYATGSTTSDQNTFPVTIGPDLTFNGGGNPLGDAFVAKVNAPGTALVYCGYIGGSSDDGGYGIAVDAAGSAYVTGITVSDEKTFPVKVGPDLTFNSPRSGLTDVFVAKVNSQGTGLDYCGYIGGIQSDSRGGIAVDAAGNAYVTGGTLSDEQTFPVKVGPDLTHNGVGDGFVAKVALTLLQGSGTPGPGGTVNLTLTASDDVGLSCAIGSSLGTGPIPVGHRRLGLSPDNLLVVSVNTYWPWIFVGYRTIIGKQGQAKAAINIPNLPALVGLKIHTAFVTISPGAPFGIKSISNTYSFQI